MLAQEKLHAAEACEKATACFDGFDLAPARVSAAQLGQTEFHLLPGHTLFGLPGYPERNCSFIYGKTYSTLTSLHD